MMNQAVVEALYSATYVEDFIDACENLPADIQRHLSRMRELDVTCQGYMRDAEGHMDNLLELMDAGDSEPVQREINSVSWKLQQLLINAQEIGDDKLQIAQQIQDFVDNKVRQLDLDKKNLEFGKETDSQELSREMKEHHHPPERSTIIKRARRARHEVFVPSILGPSTLAPTRFTSDEQKTVDTKLEAYRSCQLFDIPTKSLSQIYSSSKAESSSSSLNPTKLYTNSAGTSSSVPVLEAKYVSEKVHQSSSGSGSSSFPSTSERAIASTSSASTSAMKHDTKKYDKKQADIVEKKKYKRRKTKQTESSPPNIPIDPDEPTYCLCDQVSYGEMIGCDNDLCPIEWFHFSCVSLITKPKGKWYCPKCRGDRPNVMKPKAIFLKELEKYNREKEEKA